MSATELTSFGESFVGRVKQHLPSGFTIKDVTVLSTGLALIPNSKQENQGLKPLGCPECLGIKSEQDSEGYPTIGGKRLLSYEEANISSAPMSPELVANLWLCPNCRLPVYSLLPQFDLSAL